MTRGSGVTELTAIEVEGEGPFVLPICGPDVALLMGETMASIVLTTSPGQKIHVPVAHQTLSDLYKLLERALVDLGPKFDDPIQ